MLFLEMEIVLLLCAQVPIHLHTNWDSFYMEMLMLGGLAAYLLNFLAGKNKNSRLAQSWLAAHRQLLEENFSVIGLLFMSEFVSC